ARRDTSPDGHDLPASHPEARPVLLARLRPRRAFLAPAAALPPRRAALLAGLLPAGGGPGRALAAPRPGLPPSRPLRTPTRPLPRRRFRRGRARLPPARLPPAGGRLRPLARRHGRTRRGRRARRGALPRPRPGRPALRDDGPAHRRNSPPQPVRR